MLGVEQDLEWRGSSRDTNLELELVPALDASGHPPLAREGDTLRPGAFGRFTADRVANCN
jgi:hypothetical protein